ncbi:MAG: 3-phosphoshikimate 1-carboxyvinyltransferase [Flavobacteriales bacterium]|nr:3-phosphoshikimate 1-carboxyvinyltransferase [Flavobacteriales bacterium]
MIHLNYKESPDNARTVSLPISKSIMNRELILRASSTALFPSISSTYPDDVNILIRALTSRIKRIDIGAAGTAMRFSTAYFATGDEEKSIHGSARMHERPIKELVDALKSLGADINYLGIEGYPPILIKPVTSMGGSVAISGSTSSQYISALLLSGHRMKKGLRLALTPPISSRPYIDMTLAVMKENGIRFEIEGNTVSIAHQKVESPKLIKEEKDWSAAAFFYGLVSLGKPDKLLLEGLHLNSVQGDRFLADLYEPLGVSTEETLGGILIKKVKKSEGEFSAQLQNTPDLAQAMAFTCAALGIQCHLTGLHSLRIKETDRIAAIAECLSQCGIEVDQGSDYLSFSGRLDQGSEPVFKSYHDHRMAMSCSILASCFESICIRNPEVVNKSFPNFWNEMNAIGYQSRIAT